VYVCILLCFELLDFFFVRPVLFYFTVVYKNCTSKLRWINEENVIFGEIYTFKREISLEYKEIYFQNLRRNSVLATLVRSEYFCIMY
jgi:hypothetical protein